MGRAQAAKTCGVLRALRNLPVSFLFGITLLLGAAFVIHTRTLEAMGQDPYGNMLVVSYAVNWGMALVVFFALYLMRHRWGPYLGFLFLFGSLFKFVVFFLVFYPVYSADEHMDRYEFAAFFVPYALSLIIDTYFLSKMLRGLDPGSNDNGL